MRDEGGAAWGMVCLMVMTSAGTEGTERLAPEFARQIAAARLWGWEGVGVGPPGLRSWTEETCGEEHID